MKKTVLMLAFGAIALLLSADHLVAQDLSRFLVEGRFGVIGIPTGGFLDISQGNHFSLGGLFSYRPVTSEKSILSRLTLRGSLDGAGLGGQTSPEAALQGFNNIERLYLVNFAVGIDALHTSRYAITLHGGAALSRDHFVVQEFSPFGGSFGSGGLVGACNLGPGLCQSIWNFIGNAGVEGRWVPKKAGPCFLSVWTTHASRDRRIRLCSLRVLLFSNRSGL